MIVLTYFLAGIFLIWSSLIIVQIISVHCIFSSQGLKLIFEIYIFKIFLSETTRHVALIFGLKHCLVDIYHVCSNYAPGAKNGPTPGHMFHIVLYGKQKKKYLLV